MHTKYSFNKSEPNSAAVSQLLNTDIWKPIKENATEKSKIDFVIGGATVEMWCAAWNKNMPETGTNKEVNITDMVYRQN